MLPEIYCDMDGVLVDFFGYVTAQGYELPEGPIDGPLKEFILENGEHFWANLPKLNDALHLWDFIGKHKPSILTAKPHWDPNAPKGKFMWLQKYCPVDINKFHCVRRSHKNLYAINNKTGQSNLLIDDYIKNCEEFRSAGGIAIHHVSAKVTIEKLKRLGFI